MGVLWETIKRTFSDFSEDDCSTMAAALAYYAAFSLAPLLVLVILITGIFVEPEEVQSNLTGQLQTFLGPEGTEQIKTMLAQANRPDLQSWGSIVSAIALLLGASGVFVQIQGALNRAWEVEPDPEKGGIKNFVTKRLLSMSMLLVLVFLMLISLVLSAAIAAAGSMFAGWLPGGLSEGFWHVVSVAVTFVLIGLLFAAIYKILPDAKVQWRETWLGASVAAFLFSVGKFAFGYYVGKQNLGATFGGAASLAVILLWVYFSGVVLFLGAEFTQAWAQRHGAPLEPKENAVKVVKRKEQLPARA